MRGLSFGILFMSVLLMGCNRGPATYPVSGVVTWQGKPIEDGYIVFVADDGLTSPATGTIKNGQYSTRATAGMKTVQIYADYDKGFDKAMNQNIRAPLVTPEYNAHSKIKFEVATQENTLDLKLPQE